MVDLKGALRCDKCGAIILEYIKGTYEAIYTCPKCHTHRVVGVNADTRGLTKTVSYDSMKTI